MRSCCCSFLPLAANIPSAPSNRNLYVHFPSLCHSLYALLTLPWTEWRGRGKETRAQPFYPLPLRLWWHNSFLLSPSALSKNPILFSQIAREGKKEKNLRSLRFQRRGQKVCVLFHCLLFHPSRAPRKKEKQPLCSSFLFPPFRPLSSISRINQESFLPPPQISMLIARPTGPKREKRSGRG